LTLSFANTNEIDWQIRTHIHTKIYTHTDTRVKNKVGKAGVFDRCCWKKEGERERGVREKRQKRENDKKKERGGKKEAKEREGGERRKNEGDGFKE